MPITVVHAADLHIDSPLRGLSRYDGAPWEIVASATRQAFSRLVELCREREAALLILSGDLFDGTWRDFNTGLFFVAELARLRESGCQVVMLRGNHDAQSIVERKLPLPAHVHELSTHTAETVRFERLGISVTGQGFAQRSVVTDLAAGYPAADPNEFSIAVLHTSLDGREGHDSYAPTKLGTLLDKGYGYWALGHVHTREEVHESVVFPGNLQGRHARETGPKGAMLLEIEHGRLARREFVPLDVVRWEHLLLDVSEAQSGLDAVDLACARVTALQERAERTLAVRVTLTGTPAAPLARDPEQLLNALRASLLGQPVYVEKLRIRSEARAREAHPLLPYLVQAADDLHEESQRILAELPAEIVAEVLQLVGEDRQLVEEALRHVSQRLGGDG